MKKVVVLLLLFMSGFNAFGQSSQLSPNSIQIPQVSGVSSIENPANGMLIYNLSDQSLYYRKENEWVKINNSANNVTSTPVIYYKITPSASSPAIPGEITSGTHNGQTPVNNLDYDLSTTLDPDAGTGAGTGKTVFSAIKFSKSRGPNSIPFFRAVTTGTHWDSIEFLFYDGTDQLYYSVKFSTAFVTKIEKSELAGIDNIELKCTKIGYKDYTKNPAVTGSFDLKLNQYSATY